MRGCLFIARRFFAQTGRAAVTLLGSLLPVMAALAGPAQPVELCFRLPAAGENPFAREIWAEVITPARATLRLPAFFLGNDRFAVRARATETGEYRLGRVTENSAAGSAPLPLAVTPENEGRQTVREVQTLPAVTGVRGRPAGFRLGNGATYTPVGANVAWARGAPPVDFYRQACAEFGRQGLNWMRVWMAHWGGTNLDWRSKEAGASPAPGSLDLQVAADWDRIVAAAEEQGVYLQLVLQHHGQYSTKVNSNWDANPWNAAHAGGFLKTPQEFFTSPRARELTLRKYRYIVARWGYSPAILAWELFNEVHWVDAMQHGGEDAVARWHDEMAAGLRGMDPYRHLVTTSTENLHSPIYAQMDYDQPHLYAADMLAAARRFAVPPAELDRPVFYGEAGDDNMGLSSDVKASGIAIVPPVWASLMGQGRLPAQPWLGAELRLAGRLGELGAVARFVQSSGLGRREGLGFFSPVVDCPVRVPFTLAGGQSWQRWPAPEFELPLDGREPLELGEIPRVFPNSAESRKEGFPGRATYHIDFPQEMTLHARVTGAGAKGAELRVAVDGRAVLEKTWTARPAATPAPGLPAVLPFTVPAGRHTLVVENPGSPDWFELAGIDFPVEIPVLAAIGRRSGDFIAVWVWHRAGVFALTPPAPVGGGLVLDAVPAGTWHVTWWDTLKGEPAGTADRVHPGGTLRLEIPPLSRHLAVWLERRETAAGGSGR